MSAGNSAKAQALAAHLDHVEASVSTPWQFIHFFTSWLMAAAASARTASQQLIDTPEEREAIIQVVLTRYDKLTASIMLKNVSLGTMFKALRTAVEQALDLLFLALAPPPAPLPTTPAPPFAPPPANPSGSASP